MSSGGAALMAVQVLVDHGVPQEKIVFVTYFAGKAGLNRLTKVFPEMKVVVCSIVGDHEERVRPNSPTLFMTYKKSKGSCHVIY
jgi:uridine kinase